MVKLLSCASQHGDALQEWQILDHHYSWVISPSPVTTEFRISLRFLLFFSSLGSKLKNPPPPHVAPKIVGGIFYSTFKNGGKLE